ncbi:MAG TPA: phenylalanine--tRNA ligase subunit beta [Candidatus Omnitrophota bacterium]|nr:phenylalanine--tRNA ligase subunit beta [Candidatus Omnitrophota bacterium]
MKISYSWIKELVDIKISPEKLAEFLTMAGLNVDSLEKTGNDWLYDIEITSNRPDWLSVRGIVHEILAMTGSELKKPLATSYKPQAKNKKGNKPVAGSLQPVAISIENEKDCKFYYGNVITDVKVGPSPEWLKNKLETLGMRSVNNVVDITNFCLLELGQPLHAFDLDKLSDKKIIVRRAKKGESLILIDGSKKDLGQECLVIADSQRPVAIAGVMGGQATEVTGATKNILLESACFDPIIVRRCSRVLGVKSDSSYRFERGVDEITVKDALERATRLICDICSGSYAGTKVAGKPKEPKDKKIRFDISKGMDLLGVSIPTAKAKDIFKGLGFKVKPVSANVLEITVPSFRRDISIAQDLTEELVRVWGYENIPLTACAIKPFQMEKPKVDRIDEKIKDVLVKSGLKEITTYSLVGEADYSKTSIPLPEKACRLINPLSKENSILRTTLIPSLLNCVAFNVNQANHDLALFESASVYSVEKEDNNIAVALCGNKTATWLKDESAYSIYDLKGLIEVVFQEAGVRSYDFIPIDLEYSQASTGCKIVSNGQVLGFLCQINPSVKKAWGIKGKEEVFVAELFLEKISSQADLKKCFEGIMQFPGIVRDLSIIASKDASYAKIKGLILKEAGQLVRKVSVVETYQGKEVPQGSLSLTISIEYGSDSKTMTDEEVNSIHQKVLSAIATLNIKIR